MAAVALPSDRQARGREQLSEYQELPASAEARGCAGGARAQRQRALK